LRPAWRTEAPAGAWVIYGAGAPWRAEKPPPRSLYPRRGVDFQSEPARGRGGCGSSFFSDSILHRSGRSPINHATILSPLPRTPAGAFHATSIKLSHPRHRERGRPIRKCRFKFLRACRPVRALVRHHLPDAHRWAASFASSICFPSTPSNPPSQRPNAAWPLGLKSFSGRVRIR